MLQILDPLFSDLNFKKNPDTENGMNIYYRTEENSIESIEYFIVYTAKTISEWKKITERQIIVSLQRNDPAFMKNSSLIILYEDDREVINFEREIIEVEEDPYFFKKYVLYYTPEELKALSTAYKEEIKKGSVLDKIKKDSKNDLEFNNYLEGKKVGYYLFLLRILIKIPIINLEIKTKSQENLAALINNELEKRKLKSVHDKLANKTNTKNDILKLLRETNEN